MKLDIDYKNDNRWETFDKDHAQFDIPNVFVDTLITYAPKIKHLKKINPDYIIENTGVGRDIYIAYV